MRPTAWIHLILDSLLAREALGPTGVGHGVALPHARMTGLKLVVGAFVFWTSPSILTP